MSQQMRRFLTLVLVFTLHGNAFGHTIITRVSDGAPLTVPQLAAAASLSEVVLIGESHDDPYHHELQLELLKALQPGKSPLAIGLEMMQSDAQKELDGWVAGSLGEPEIRQAFERNWSDWELYRDIFIFARQHRIPMVALNVPINIVRKVSRDGFASLTPEERKNLPPGTSCDLNSRQIAFLRKSFGDVQYHLQSGKKFNNFCEAQTVRNSGMAVAITRYLAKEPRRKLVVLTGVWHAVKYGIPEQLRRLGSGLHFTVILPETPYLNSGNSGENEADYLVEL